MIWLIELFILPVDAKLFNVEMNDLGGFLYLNWSGKLILLLVIFAQVLRTRVESQ